MMSNFTKPILVALLLCFSMASYAATWHVRSGSTGTGTSWANAFGTLEQALASASAGDEIWVSAGLYKPTTDLNYNATLNTAMRTYNIPSGVRVFGGFPSIGNPGMTSRDPQTHITTLSGDHTGNDVGILSYNHSTLKENSLNVVWMHNVASGTVLDGFQITGGCARLSKLQNGDRRYNGGGIYMLGASEPAIRNCSFYWNMAYNSGGCIYVYPGFVSGVGYLTARPTIENCNFHDNLSYNIGSAIGLDASPVSTIEGEIVDCSFQYNLTRRGGSAVGANCRKQGHILVQMDRSYFLKNYTKGRGGCVYLDSRDGYANFDVSNCLFEKNGANREGGVFYAQANKARQNHHRFVNNTVVENYSDQKEGMFFVQVNSAPLPGQQHLEFYNNIFHKNIVAGGIEEWVLTQPLTYTDAANNAIDAGTCPPATNCLGGMIYGATPNFVSGTDYRLQTTSAMVEAGDNSRVFAWAGQDLDQTNRIVGVAVDMGCYENANPPCNTIVHVNKIATGANNGTSWADAYVDLQDALAYARNNPGCVKQIWVAEGNYYPTATTDRSISFDLVDQIEMYGGFPNTGNPTFVDRNWTMHQTFLSGDIDQNGSLAGNSYSVVTCGELTSGTFTDGFYVIDGYGMGSTDDYGGGITFRNPSGLPVTSQPVFQNMVLRNHESRGGMMVLMTSAVAGHDIQPRFNNVTFQSSSGGQVYGAILMRASVNGTIAPSFYDCTFHNLSGKFGGAICIISQGGGVMRPFVERGTFFNNYADSWGGAVCVSGTFAGSLADIDLRNSLFYNNTSGFGGGAVAVANNNGSTARAELFNCTLHGNSAATYGGSLLVDQYSSSNPAAAEMKLYNTIVWNSSAGVNGDVIWCRASNGTAVADFNQCLVDASSCSDPARMATFGAGVINCAGAMQYNANPMFVSTVAGSEDFRLDNCSPAEDTGDNGFVGTSTTDLELAVRIQNTTVNLGCYETQPGCIPPCPSIIYVNQNATGANDGTSWADAYVEVRDALAWVAANSCTQEIWVAEGTWYPTAGTDRTTSFELVEGVTMYGGFPDFTITGNPANPTMSDRDWDAYPSILSGDIGIGLYPDDNSYKVVRGGTLSSATITDGFVIRDAYAKNGPSWSDGSALWLEVSDPGVTADPVFRNITFTENSSSSGPGIMVRSMNTGSTIRPLFADCHIDYNHTFSYAAMAVEGGGAGTLMEPQVENCTFIGNDGILSVGAYNGAAIISIVTAGAEHRGTYNACTFANNDGHNGGSVCLTGSGTNSLQEPTFTNCQFYDNQASYGGAVYLYGNSGLDNHPYFKNCTFFRNSASQGGVLTGYSLWNATNYAVRPELHNCIVNSNTSTSGAGDVAHMIDNAATATYPNVLTLNTCLVDAPLGCTDPNAFNMVNGPSVNCVGTMDYTGDPVFVDVTAGSVDLRLDLCSDAEDAGSNALATGISFDLDGANRIQNGTVNLGAFESQPGCPPPCPPIVHVNAAATGANNGTSWADAFTNFRDAMDFARTNTGCVNEVWVAAGTYYATGASASGSNGIHIDVINGMPVYGGFPNTGNPVFADRDWMVHQTFLDGDFQQDGNYGNNTFEFFESSNALGSGTLIDGFYMTNLRGDAFELFLSGGNTTAQFSNMVIDNCQGSFDYAVSSTVNLTIDNVTVQNCLGGVGHSVSISGTGGVDNTVFSNCTWQNNSQGGVSVSAGGSSQITTTFLNCTFSNNACFTGGGVLTNDASGFSSLAAPQFINCLMYNNSAQDGGVVFNFSTGGSAEPEFTNCTLYGNTASQFGGVLFNGPSDFGSEIVRFKNSIVWNSSANWQGFIAYFDDVNGCAYPSELWFEDCMVDAFDEFDMPAFEYSSAFFGFPCAFTVGMNTTWNWAPPSFVSTTAGSENFRQLPGSLGIDVGNNAHVPAFATTDLVGNIRIDGSSVDKGCYENFPGMLKLEDAQETPLAESAEAVSVSAYPNPTAGRLTIALSGEGTLAQAKLYSSAGKLVKQQSSTATQMLWTLDDLAPGLYLLEVEHSAGTHLTRVVVQ